MKPDTHFDIATACPELKLGSIATRHSLLLLSSLPMSSPVTSYPPLFTRHSASGARSDSRKKIDAKIDEIIDFAEIREFIDTPVQSYSSGYDRALGVRRGHEAGFRIFGCE
jgi:ABC-type polysaccharide/polyol phosphate transport system ATPase subunit